MEWESGTPNFETNLQRAGELFIYSLWIQGQMADLAIFACRPDLIAPFLANPSNVPDEFAALRLTAWQKEFGSIRADFLQECSRWVSGSDARDLNFLQALRNAIAHSHVSMGRDYFLYRPITKNEQQVIGNLQLSPRDQSHDPPVIKVAFHDHEYYSHCHSVIQRLDEQCMARVAAGLGVTHSRIR